MTTALWLLLVVMAAVALAVWTRLRARNQRATATGSSPRPRYDSTLGELRDLRRALRPVQKDPRLRAASEHAPGSEPGG